MFAMILKDQAEICQRLLLTYPPCVDMKRAIKAALEGDAGDKDADLIRAQLQRFVDNGRGIAKTEAKRALAKMVSETPMLATPSTALHQTSNRG